MVNYAPLVEITSAEADYRRFDQLIAKSFTQITNRSCDSVTDFLAYPKEKGGLGLLMPGFFHRGRGGSGLPHASTGARTRWTCPWGAGPAGERRTSTASSRTDCPTSTILTTRRPSRERPAERQPAHTTASDDYTT